MASGVGNGSSGSSVKWDFNSYDVGNDSFPLRKEESSEEDPPIGLENGPVERCELSAKENRSSPLEKGHDSRGRKEPRQSFGCELGLCEEEDESGLVGRKPPENSAQQKEVTAAPVYSPHTRQLIEALCSNPDDACTIS